MDTVQVQVLPPADLRLRRPVKDVSKFSELYMLYLLQLVLMSLQTALLLKATTETRHLLVVVDGSMYLALLMETSRGALDRRILRAGDIPKILNVRK